MKDMSEMIDRAKKVMDAEEKAADLTKQKGEIFAELWLETDFIKELNKSRPTEKDKESWIKRHPKYKDILTRLARAEAIKNYERNIYDICFVNYRE